MKRYLLLLLILGSVVSCKKETKVQREIAEIPVSKVKAERFEKLFYEGGKENLQSIKLQYPYFFPPGNTDDVWLEKMNDPLLQELYGEVKKKYPTTETVEDDLQTLFKHIKYYFPDFSAPKVVTLISEMDYENRVIYADTLLLISLDLYLGKEHKFYEGFPAYQAQNFEEKQIMSDVVTAFSDDRIVYPRDRALLSLMIYFGKELYTKDLLIPDATDAVKMGYTEEQINWANANESEIWRYFIENSLLYDTDPKLPGRFINPAPFSKFYLELDNESPGRLGVWLGWQIVRSYMENNKNVTLQELLATDAKTIFDNSKYKPKK